MGSKKVTFFDFFQSFFASFPRSFSLFFATFFWKGGPLSPEIFPPKKDLGKLYVFLTFFKTFSRNLFFFASFPRSFFVFFFIFSTPRTTFRRFLVTFSTPRVFSPTKSTCFSFLLWVYLGILVLLNVFSIVCYYELWKFRDLFTTKLTCFSFLLWVYLWF